MAWQSLWRWNAFLALVVSFSVHESLSDGPADNKPDSVRPIPPEGIAIPTAVKDELFKRAEELRASVESHTSNDERGKADILVFSRAVRLAVEQGMFYSDKEFDQARELLAEGEMRLPKLGQRSRGRQPRRDDDTPATDNPRLAVGGFRSRLDDSIQPYGLVIPAGWSPRQRTPMRLDVWLHGRGEKSSEVAFLYQRMKQVGEIAPADTFVLHPYGRYCNAFKFAGEIDILEAIEHVKNIYPIDGNRISIRGFSMGGAGCWQMAVHYPDTWFAANPGAGFSETMQFLKVFQQEDFVPTNYQQHLLHWYDCPVWSNNLRYLPTVAYSGEIDRQKQAADVMERAMAAREMKLLHLIGPNTGHKIHPDSKVEIEQHLSAWAKKGRDAVPQKIDLTTYSLRYNKRGWLTITGLGEHWTEARVQAELKSPNQIFLTTQNVTRLELEFEPTRWPLAAEQAVEIVADGQKLAAAPPQASAAWTVKLERVDQKWRVAPAQATAQQRLELAKRPGMQGPIDDAFMDSFLFVKASGKSTNPAVEKWIQAEYEHATSQWRRHYRGDIQERLDTELSGEDITNKNLIVFGDPNSNRILARVARKLPIQWESTELRVGSQGYPASNHALVMVYPNPLNPRRYLVVNSGFTFREYAYLNNARQIPMLPDWAIVDVAGGATSQLPGKIPAAGFFDERWQLKSTN